MNKKLVAMGAVPLVQSMPSVWPMRLGNICAVFPALRKFCNNYRSTLPDVEC